MDESQISKHTKLIGVLTDKAYKYTCKHSGLNRGDFKILLAADFLASKNNHFTTRSIALLVTDNTYITNAVTRLKNAGYIESLPGSSYLPLGNKGVRRLLTKYALTGKGLYLVRKYSEYVRKLIADLEG